jgi:fluoride ion exporter CrcB/FEX
MTLLMIALGAAVGAPTRYFAGRDVLSRHESVCLGGR